MNPLESAIEQVGWMPLAKALDVRHQAIRKWAAAGRLPRSEFSGETDYASVIERETGGKVSKEALIRWSREAWSGRAA